MQDGPLASDPNAGHRERLRARFLKGGADAMPDYELLELALFAALPRKDTKPLAKALLARFGSFAEVIAAPRDRLREIPGVGDAVANQLKIVEAAAARLAQTRVIGRPALSSWSALLDYCMAAMARAPAEEFRVLFLDRKNVLIADEVQARGTVDHTPVYPREIVKRALEHGASAIILVHNHPSGDPTPSKADIEMTREIAHRRQGAQDRSPRSSGHRARRPCQFQIAGIALSNDHPNLGEPQVRMNRRHLLRSAAALSLLRALPAGAAPFHRVRPGDADWPSIREWEALRATTRRRSAETCRSLLDLHRQYGRSRLQGRDQATR